MSTRVATVLELFRALADEGIEGVLERTPDDVVWAPLTAEGREFVGAEVREHFRAQRREATDQQQRIGAVEEHGNAVLVVGSLQLRSREARVDLQPCWVYEFDDEDRLRRASGYPSRRQALAALAEQDPEER